MAQKFRPAVLQYIFCTGFVLRYCYGILCYVGTERVYAPPELRRDAQESAGKRAILCKNRLNLTRHLGFSKPVCGKIFYDENQFVVYNCIEDISGLDFVTDRQFGEGKCFTKVLYIGKKCFLMKIKFSQLIRI